MRGILRVPVLIVVAAGLGCSPSAPTRPSETVKGAQLPSWLTVAAGRGSGGLSSSAVINGFRVHPDPGDDGVIRVFTDENVVVNGADIKADPPAQSFLVVNWGDGPNQRARAAVPAARIMLTRPGATRWSRASTAPPPTPRSPSTSRCRRAGRGEFTRKAPSSPSI